MSPLFASALRSKKLSVLTPSAFAALPALSMAACFARSSLCLLLLLLNTTTAAVVALKSDS
jgi:hypothetical protein